MCSLFCYFSFIYDQNIVGIGYARQAVSDHQHGFSFGQFFQGLLYQVFVFRVGKSGSLVEYDDGSIFQEGSG